MITEGELLEMDIRLRKLESDLGLIKPHLDHEATALERKQSEWTGESNYATAQWSKWQIKIDRFELLRENIDRGVEAVREDMDRMAEFARKSLETVG